MTGPSRPVAKGTPAPPPPGVGVPAAQDHPWSEWDPDPEIGRLKWRIQRRAESISMSQDGYRIIEMEQHQDEDREELARLVAKRAEAS
jgi:hypothetical protein